MMEVTKVVIVGIGGIGTHLVFPFCRYLAYKHPEISILLIDGDEFENANATRQTFESVGNKAAVTAATLKRIFPDLEIEAKPTYLTEDNIFMYVTEGSHVLSGVDNHATRKLLSDHVGTLRDCVLISGGNQFDDGNVQLYIRAGGNDVTDPLTRNHPEIENPTDRNPAELSCVELAATSKPQLIFTNFAVASLMMNTFYVVTEIHTDEVPYNELYFDIPTGRQRPVLRR